MRSVKHRPHSIQRDPDSGAPALGEFGSERLQKSFDVSPFDRRLDRILENPVEGVAVAVVQREYDTAFRYRNKWIFRAMGEARARKKGRFCNRPFSVRG